MGNEPCESLPWDSGFFGFGVARVRGAELTAARCPEIDAWCRGHGVACLYFGARSDDAATARLAEANGYKLADVRLTFEREPDYCGLEPAAVRAVRAADVPGFKTIARESYGDSRFYFDERFPRAKCDELYELWIEKSCTQAISGIGAVLVWEDQGAGQAFVTCGVKGNAGSIGLVGVARAARGGGVGKGLVDAALAWFLEQGITRVTVVTQARNIAAQRLYQRCGFLTCQVEMVYHKWFDGAGDGR